MSASVIVTQNDIEILTGPPRARIPIEQGALQKARSSKRRLEDAGLARVVLLVDRGVWWARVKPTLAGRAFVAAATRAGGYAG